MSRAWLKVEGAVIRHPKVRRVAERMGVAHLPGRAGAYLVVGFLIAWWDYCAEFSSGGRPADVTPETLADFAAPLVGLSNLAVVPHIADVLREEQLMDRYGHPWDFQDYTGSLLKKRAADVERKRTSRGQGAERRADSIPKSRVEQSRVSPPPPPLAATPAEPSPLEQLVGEIPSDYWPAIEAAVRPAKNPAAVIASIRALGPDGIHAPRGVTWAVLGHALQDWAASGEPFRAKTLATFVGALLRPPAERSPWGMDAPPSETPSERLERMISTTPKEAPRE